MSPTEAHDLPEPSAAIARAMIRSLTRGTTIGEGARFFHVGHEEWLAAQQELLDEIAEDGHADTKFVRGAYGAGKSHFLAMAQDAAGARNWVCTHIECKSDGVQIDRFETLYPRLVAKLRASDMGGDTSLDPVRHLLDRWTALLMTQAGMSPDAVLRSVDSEARLYARLEKGLLRGNLPSDFVRALCAFPRASLAGDFETTTGICRWMRGEAERMRVADHYCRPPLMGRRDVTSSTELRPIGKGNAAEAMRALLWLIKAAGYAGLVLCIDEIEELAKLTSKKRQDQALQALREFVDHAGGDGGFRHLCVYLAATPEMFEGENYFPRYDALATRIQAVSAEVNWRGPVIDLDRTPLTVRQLRELAERICRIHAIAYGGSEDFAAIAESAVAVVSETKFRIARPRLLARVLVDHLERTRSAGFARAGDIREGMRAAAAKVAQEPIA